MRVFLGVDTSCYTTSVAIMSNEGQLLADVRRLLQVKQGNRGLAQSEMVFQHVRNFPGLFASAISSLPSAVNFGGIAVSAVPRDVQDSYMPAFLVGRGFARVIAQSHAVPLHEISHQTNHIFAGVWSANGPQTSRFLAVHASGGTTEIVLVSGSQPTIELLGGSIDIAAGQLIDRIGVALALQFPAGPQLEQIARTAMTPVVLPVAVKQLKVSFAGPETQARRLLARGAAPADVAAGVQHCVAQSIWRLIQNGCNLTGVSDVLLVGGVTSNQFIRDYLECKSKTAQSTVKLFFPERKFSPDNAAGAAYFAYQQRHC